METRKCAVCGKDKPLSEMSKSYPTRCKECVAEHGRVSSGFATYIFIAELTLRYADNALNIGINNGTISKEAKRIAKQTITDISVIRSSLRKYIKLKDDFEVSHTKHSEIMQKDILIFYFTVKSWLDKNREENSGDKAYLVVALAMTYAAYIAYSRCSSLSDTYTFFGDIRMTDPNPVYKKIVKITELMHFHKAQTDPLVERAWTIIVQKIASEETLDYITTKTA